MWFFLFKLRETERERVTQRERERERERERAERARLRVGVRAGQAGAHQVWARSRSTTVNTIISDAAQLLRGATQAFGETRARLLQENPGDFAPREVVLAPRGDGALRTAKYQAALEGGHDVLVLISDVWGGFSPEAMRFLGELAQARNDGIDITRG